jgi:type VI secretion system protein ImpG
LFELLHASAVASLTGVPGQMADNPHVVTTDALVHEGLAPEQSLLPLQWNTWHGHNLLHEYFACPSRFYFFALQNLAPGLSRIQGKEAEIVVLLTQDTTKLSGLVDKDQFALFCTPVVNLFEQRTDRIELNNKETEFHLVPDRARPMDFDLMVTDYNMPGYSGVQLLRAAKAIRPGLPVALASGYVTPEIEQNAFDAGASALVYKPNDVNELCETVQRLIQGGDAS